MKVLGGGLSANVMTKGWRLDLFVPVLLLLLYLLEMGPSDSVMVFRADMCWTIYAGPERAGMALPITSLLAAYSGD